MNRMKLIFLKRPEVVILSIGWSFVFCIAIINNPINQYSYNGGCLLLTILGIILFVFGNSLKPLKGSYPALHEAEHSISIKSPMCYIPLIMCLLGLLGYIGLYSGSPGGGS